jgi:hypothetical protein
MTNSVARKLCRPKRKYALDHCDYCYQEHQRRGAHIKAPQTQSIIQQSPMHSYLCVRIGKCIDRRVLYLTASPFRLLEVLAMLRIPSVDINRSRYSETESIIDKYSSQHAPERELPSFIKIKSKGMETFGVYFWHPGQNDYHARYRNDITPILQRAVRKRWVTHGHSGIGRRINRKCQ